MTKGCPAGPLNSSGDSIVGLDSPFLTVSLHDELSLPDSQRISPSSSISTLLKTSWCLPPPKFLISTLEILSLSYYSNKKTGHQHENFSVLVLKIFDRMDKLTYHQAQQAFHWKTMQPQQFGPEVPPLALPYPSQLLRCPSTSYWSDSSLYRKETQYLFIWIAHKRYPV